MEGVEGKYLPVRCDFPLRHSLLTCDISFEVALYQDNRIKNKGKVIPVTGRGSP
jgi:hypothetical protein